MTKNVSTYSKNNIVMKFTLKITGKSHFVCCAQSVIKQSRPAGWNNCVFSLFLVSRRRIENIGKHLFEPPFIRNQRGTPFHRVNTDIYKNNWWKQNKKFDRWLGRYSWRSMKRNSHSLSFDRKTDDWTYSIDAIALRIWMKPIVRNLCCCSLTIQ